MATTALGAGLGIILGTLNVFVRDIAQVVPIVLQVLFWFTPIVYPLSIIPQAYHQYLVLNPVFPLVSSYQNILVFGTAPNLIHLTMTILLSAFLLLIAFFIFSKASEEMADVL